MSLLVEVGCIVQLSSEKNIFYEPRKRINMLLYLRRTLVLLNIDAARLLL
jgi:hypothetical protein